MKYSISTILMLVCAVTHSAPREPNRSYIQKMDHMRRSRGIQEQTTAAICAATTTRNHSFSNSSKIIEGSIVMPSEGIAEGRGTHFNYSANAETATIEISFDEPCTAYITAKAHDIYEKRNVIIIDQTESSVVLYIENFSLGTPTMVEFEAIA